MTGDIAFVDLTTSDTHKQRVERQRVAPISPWAGGSSVLYLSDWQTAALKGVYKVRGLSPNWDNEGGTPPSDRLIDFAAIVVTSLFLEDLPIPFVVPTPRGGLQFEWNEGRRELDVEILPDCSLEFLKVENGEPMEEGPATFFQLHGLFKWLRNDSEKVMEENRPGSRWFSLGPLLVKNFLGSMR